MHPKVKKLLAYYQFERLPVEGTFYRQSYRSKSCAPGGGPAGTAIIGMYCETPLSVSCFHRLQHDEVWHFYGGDPFHLYLLYDDGRAETIEMGPDTDAGQHIQYVVPAGVWQGGGLKEGGVYALFGCTMAPGFTGDCFEAGIAEQLVATHPDMQAVILKLSVNGAATHMPEGFESGKNI